MLKTIQKLKGKNPKHISYFLIVKFDTKIVTYLFHSLQKTCSIWSTRNKQQMLQFKHWRIPMKCPFNWSIRRLLLLYCAQGAFLKQCFLTLTLLVSSKPPFPSPAFSTHTDGFPSKEESPSFPRTLLYRSNRAEGAGYLSQRPRHRPEVTSASSTVPVEHGWAHQAKTACLLDELLHVPLWWGDCFITTRIISVYSSKSR